MAENGSQGTAGPVGVEVGKVLLMPDGNHMILWDEARYTPLGFAKILAALIGAVIQVAQAQAPEVRRLISVPKLTKVGLK